MPLRYTLAIVAVLLLAGVALIAVLLMPDEDEENLEVQDEHEVAGTAAQVLADEPEDGEGWVDPTPVEGTVSRVAS